VGRSELGMKTGKGLFSYTPDEAQALRMERARKLVATRKAIES
jgi:3-hydroxybutyryl-CoA dehydrogenase/5-formyl-3-hydroxy-2-methylpyridine 4-carboxylate dehydrogenase